MTENKEHEQTQKTSENKRDLKWVTVFGFSVFLLVAVFGVYYYFFYTQQKSQLNRHYLRMLAAAAHGLESSIEELHTNVLIAGEGAWKESQAELKQGKENPSWSHESWSNRLKGKLDKITRLESFPRGIIQDDQLKFENVYSIEPDRFVEYAAALDQRQAQSALTFWYKQGKHDPIVRKAPISKLLKEMPNHDSFRNVALFTADLKYIGGTGDGHIRLVELPRPIIKKDDKEIIQKTIKSAESFEALLGGENHRVFLQPVRLSNTLQNKNSDLFYLVGIKSAGELESRQLAMPPTLVLAGLLLVLLILFFLPYLRIRFMSPFETMSASDVMLLAFALMLGFTVMALGLSYLMARDSLYKERDLRLQGLHQEITRAFKDEVSEMDLQLRQITEHRRLWLSDTDESKETPQTSILISQQAPNGGSETPSGVSNPVSTPSEYPWLSMVYWIDRNGEQIGKWDVKTQTTSMVDVSRRLYFTEALNARLWSNPGSKHEKDFPHSASGYYLQSIRSITTGEVTAVLSQHLTPHGQDQAMVAAIQSPMYSLNHTAPPPDFGFCVIDRDGQVLFHHNPNRILRENFFEELDRAKAMRALAFSNKVDTLNTSYRGEDMRMHIGPMQSGTPWSLVVFTPRQPIYTILLDMTGFALFMCFAWLGGFALFWLALRWSVASFSPPGIPFFRWYWPAENRAYGAVVSGLLLLFLIWIIVMFTSGFGTSADPTVDTQSFQVALISIKLALLAVVFVQHRLRTNTDTTRQALFDNKSNQHILMLAILMVGFLVLLFFNSHKTWLLLMGIIVLFYAILRRRLTTLFWASILGALILNTAFMPHGLAWWVISLGVLLLPLLGWGKPIDLGPFKEMRLASQYFWRQTYKLALALFIILVVIIPAISFFRLAYDEEEILLHKHRQLRFAYDISKRLENVSSIYANVEIDQDLIPKLKNRLFSDHGAKGQGVYTANSYFPFAAKSESGGGSENQTRSLQNMVQVFKDRIPEFSHFSYELRALANGSFEPFIWSNPSTTSLKLNHNAFLPEIPFGMEERLKPPSSDFIPLEIKTAVNRFDPLAGFLVLFILLPLLALSVSAITYRVFLIKYKPPYSLSGAHLQGASIHQPHQLILRRGLPGKWREDTHHIIKANQQCELDDIDQLVKQALDSKKENILLEDFHLGLLDPTVAHNKLLLLEAFIDSDKSPRILITSDIDPVYYLTSRSGQLSRDTGKGDPLLGRWASVFEHFSKNRDQLTVLDPAKEAEFLAELTKKRQAVRVEKDGKKVELSHTSVTQRLLRHIARECWPNEYLKEIGERLALHPDLDKLSAYGAVAHQIADLAESHYRAHWELCSKEERMVLYSIARDGYINWQSRHIIIRLIRRGLVVACSGFQLINQSFRIFVLRAELPEVIEEWQNRGDSVWAQLRTPILVSGVAILAFFFATQRDVFFHTTGIATALITAPPLALKLLNIVLRRQPVNVENR